MAFQKDEVYTCPDSDCGCEVTVSKGAKAGRGGNEPPRCCCGDKMLKKEAEKK